MSPEKTKGFQLAARDAVTLLREDGVAVLRDFFAKDTLASLKSAAGRFFVAAEAGVSLPEPYRFNRFSNSVLLSALTDFGCGEEDLVAPLSAPGLKSLFDEAIGGEWICSMNQSWVRKKFAPLRAPAGEYYPQGWHQDGALGVSFPPEIGPPIPMTRLLTCWVPLHACGVDSPGLEFIRKRQEGLLHFTELDDLALRPRFAAEKFCAPELEFGDGLVFLDSVLHRTYALETMRHDRLSVEYRVFPR